MKKTALTVIAAVVLAVAKGADMPVANGNGGTNGTAAVASPKVYTHVLTPEIQAKREKRRAEARARLEAMTPEARKAYLEERRKRRGELRERGKNSPRRIVKRTRAKDGTLTLERADGTVEIHKIVKPAAANAEEPTSGK